MDLGLHLFYCIFDLFHIRSSDHGRKWSTCTGSVLNLAVLNTHYEMVCAPLMCLAMDTKLNPTDCQHLVNNKYWG